MSSSRHPVALSLERVVGDDGRDCSVRLLATVMLLPLVDGIFPALVLAGALDTVAGIVQVGLLVFGGSATVAVILAELSGTRRDVVRTVLLVGVPLLGLAAIEAALAPTIAELLDLAVFRRFAALVVAAVAAKTASARVGEYLPRPAVIVGLGLVASLEPMGASLAFEVDPVTVGRGVAAGGVGLAFALGVAAAAPHLRAVVDVDRFRFGSAVALGLLPLSLLGLPFGHAPLAVLAVTGVFAYAPESVDSATVEPSSAAESTGPDDVGSAEPVADGKDGVDDGVRIDVDDDTGSSGDDYGDGIGDAGSEASGDDRGGGPIVAGEGKERPPWL